MSHLVNSDYPASPAAPVLPETTPCTAWFALYTNPRHEKHVSTHLALRKIEHFLPLYRSERRWNDGSRVILDLPLFPGYVFVRVGRRERVRALEVPGALWLVPGTGGEPAVLDDTEIQTLRRGIDSCRVEPHPLLEAGQKARIQRGPLAGMEGIVVRKKNSLRVVLTLELIMKSIAVEVDSRDLQILSA
ncbi:MAG: UpxY family transcription antiterminator [Acidobacteriaceae bacterium]